MFKKIVLTFLLVSGVFASAGNALALVYSNSFYDSISWTWSYSAPNTTSYNCLGYATGSMYWEWPWGSSNPTSTQADTYLASKGYKTSGTYAYILSYGSSTNITHFAKVTGDAWSRAKWGSLERFNHNSWSPYYSSSAYGPLVKKYYK